MSRNLIARIAVAAICIPIILWIAYQGGWWLFGMLLLFAGVATVEFLIHENFRPSGIRFWLAVVTVAAVYIVMTGQVMGGKALILGSTEISPAGGALAIMVGFFLSTAMLAAIERRPPGELMAGHARLLWGVVYLGFTYPVVFLLGTGSGLHSGGDRLLFLFGLLWIGDTAAMGIGSWLGRRKLAPSVSPAKTVAGLIGGIAGALAVGLLMFFWKFTHLGLGHVLIIALGCSLFGQLGDLVESMWKRSLGIKDSSYIIPGHGGALDRFDSLLFAAPFMYGYFRLIVS